MRILIGLAAVALLVAPASGNLLSPSDGDFETPGTSSWTGPIQWDNPVWGPGGPHTGDHYAGVQTGGNNGNPYEMQLTSIEVPPSELVTLTGFVSGGSNGQNADIYVQLISGGSVDELRINIPITYGFGWTPFSLQIHSEGHITIVAGLQLVPPIGWSNGTAIYLDTLDLVPEPASLAMFALAGLPLLRRRRR
jgi:hypothetical protein